MDTNILPIEELLENGINQFKSHFKKEPTVVGCAPGRVNIIGEHTDYNDGFVFPMALPMVTLVIGRKVPGERCIVYTTSQEINSNKEVIFSSQPVEDLTPSSSHWGNYIKGVVANFPGPLPGFEAVVTSTVPVGAGLSSSAALEVAFYTFLEALTGNRNKDLNAKALACQKAEHDFAKVPCGIMDQYVSVKGKEKHALLIDCRLPVGDEQVELKDKGIVFMIIDSGVRHDLGSSEYPKRKEQCSEAAELLGVKSLREASLEELEALEASEAVVPKVAIMRARHVISEISRTYQASKALKARDYNSLGLLMCQSHNSLRDDYEVSCPELDEIVDTAVSCEGVYGCRMTGGGFGGCAIALVKKEAVNGLINAVKTKCKGKPKFYIATPSQGARIIKLKD